MFLEISKQWFLALYFSPSCGEYYNSTSIFLVSLWKFSKVQIPLYNYKFFILILLKMSFFFFFLNSQKAYFRKHNQVRHIKLLLKKKKKSLVFQELRFIQKENDLGCMHTAWTFGKSNCRKATPLFNTSYFSIDL